MKKIIILVFSMAVCLCSYAQNLQIHYDMRHSLHKDIGRSNHITTTFEMFKPDPWGATFLFADFDFNARNGNIGLVYTEISRDFKIKDFKIMPHIEFNGGLGIGGEAENYYGFSINNAYIAGAAYSFSFKPFFINTYFAYKYNAFTKASHDWQWTMSWNANLWDNIISLNGFIDLWSENKNRTKEEGPSGKKIVLLTEPQLWINITEKFSVGSEIEISNNFYGGGAGYKNKVYILPTLAAKWIF